MTESISEQKPCRGHLDVRRNGPWGRAKSGVEQEDNEEQAGSEGHGNDRADQET